MPSALSSRMRKASRAIGSPGLKLRTSSLGGSLSRTEPKRTRSLRLRSVRAMRTAAVISSAVSGSRGCETTAGGLPACTVWYVSAILFSFQFASPPLIGPPDNVTLCRATRGVGQGIVIHVDVTRRVTQEYRDVNKFAYSARFPLYPIFLVLWSWVHQPHLSTHSISEQRCKGRPLSTR